MNFSKIKGVFEKLPFRKWMEKMPSKITDRIPFIIKAIPFANYIGSGFAVLILVGIISVVGGSPKKTENANAGKSKANKKIEMVSVNGGEFEAFDFTKWHCYISGTNEPNKIDYRVIYKDLYSYEGCVRSYPLEKSTIKVSDYKISKNETTYKQWYDVLKWATAEERGDNRYRINDSGCEGTKDEIVAGTPPSSRQNHPVTKVSSEAVMVWCNALSEKENLEPVYYWEGKVIRDQNIFIGEDYHGWEQINYEKFSIDFSKNGYRLPTYYEWFYAAKGGKPGSYDWGMKFSGSDTASEVGWCREECGWMETIQDLNEFLPEYGTKPVATKKPNSLGLYDMSGNVEELLSYYPIEEILKGEGLTIEYIKELIDNNSDYDYIPEANLLFHWAQPRPIGGSWRNSSNFALFEYENQEDINSSGFASNDRGFRVAQSIIK